MTKEPTPLLREKHDDVDESTDAYTHTVYDIILYTKTNVDVPVRSGKVKKKKKLPARAGKAQAGYTHTS